MNKRGTPTPYRDEQLGAELRELEVPEHQAAFYADLRRRVAEERTVAKRRSGPRWGLRLAGAAAVAAIVVVTLGIPRTDRTPRIAGPDFATAAVVKAHLQRALASMQNLSGTLVSDGPRKADMERWRFTLDAAGDVRLEGPAQGEAITYDASTGIARSAQRSASLGAATLFYAERHGVAPGPPDQGPPTWLLPEQFGAFVRAALAAGDPAVREITYDRRPAWRLDVDTVPNAIVPEFSGDRFQITVDRETGMPVRIVETKRGAVLRELRIENLAVNGPLPAATFRLQFPAGAEVMRSNDGFRRVKLEEVTDAVGYEPLVPTSVPNGYKLAEVAIARESAPTGKEGGNPASRRVVSLSYRRGLDQFLVTTRIRGLDSWSDPLATGEGFNDNGERLRLDGGALAGSEAQLVIVPRGIPHLWALTDELVVTIAGDLSRTELIHLADSLQSR